MAATIFVVDDDNLYRRVLVETLNRAGYEVNNFATGEEALNNVDSPDLLVIDFYLNSQNRDAMNGIDTIRKARETNASLPVIVLSGRADLSNSSGNGRLIDLLQQRDSDGLCEAFKEGAYFYLMKNNKTQESLLGLTRALLS